MKPVFDRILIANRSEIANRIARAAADLDIASVAVFAEDDEHSLHVKKADLAVGLAGRGVRAYLDIDQLIALALAQGCDAIHPPRLRLPVGERRLLAALPGGGYHLHRRLPGVAGSAG